MLVLFGLLAARFSWLQVMQHDKYQTMAEQNRISLVPIAPPRGIIYDRNGVVLAHNFSAYTLEITPSRVGVLEDCIDRLNKIIEITPKDRRRFKKLMEDTKDFESLPIKTRLTDEEVARFAANSYQFPGVEVKARLFRQYPLGEVASHLIGYIGRINEKKIWMIWTIKASWPITVAPTISVRSVLKKVTNNICTAPPGLKKSKSMPVVAPFVLCAARRRSRVKNLILSVDIKLQQIAENAFGDRKGALVAIDPKNGGVLAFVSKPGFDPNLFVDGIDPQSWNDLNTSPDKPLNNRALRGTYPPGSTFKPFMALGALEGNFRSPNQVIADTGVFNFGGHTFHDDKVGGHGMVDMYRSIVVSCDVYYYSLANVMGIDAISRFMGSMDFGKPTGVDINGEQPGVLPSQEWKKKTLPQSGAAKNGLLAKPSPSALARATTPIPRCKWRMLPPRWPMTAENIVRIWWPIWSTVKPAPARWWNPHPKRS